MTRYSRLIRECSWKYPGCHRLLGVSIPTAPGQTGTTHAVCEACETKMKGEQHAQP